MATKTLREEIKRTKPFEHLEEEVFLNLLRTHCVLAEDPFQLFKSEGLSAPLHNILRILRGAEPDGLPSLEIAERMVTRVPDITRLVDRLEKLGFAMRQRSQTDRRVVRVRISRKGIDKIEKIRPRILEIHQHQFASFSREELKTLNRLLVKARQ
jgi:DNA-binding MarR family transcriptional regulator